jgi:hypothetical protein
VCPLPCATTLDEARFCFAKILKAVLDKLNEGFNNIGESNEERVNIW